MLDLLFENPIIIGVVIYFIWTLFKPAKHEKKPPVSKSPIPRQYNDTQEEKRYYAEDTRDKEVLTTQTTINQGSPRPKVTVTESSSTPTVAYDYALEKQRLEERKRKAEAALKKLNNDSSRAVNYVSRPRNSRLIRPTQNQLREAIIWSEILGKPRSKRQSIR